MDKLTSLGLMTADISEINLTGHKNLMSLNLRNCKISQIDLTELYNLRYLNIGYNKLTSIDVTRNTMLESLICDSPHLEISEIDLSNNRELKTLCFGSNYTNYSSPIKHLDLSNNTKLESLEIRGCWELDPINLSIFPNLKVLGLQKLLKYTDVDLSSNPSLTTLQVYGMPIVNLDLSKNLLLEDVDTRQSNLFTLDVSMLEALKTLKCDRCNLSELNISENKMLESISCGNQYSRETGEYIEMVLYISAEQKEMWLDQESFNNHVRVEMVTE